MKYIWGMSLLCVSAYSSTLVFTNEADWQSAFYAAHSDGTVLQENFAGNHFNVPGLQFESVSGPKMAFPGPGYILNDAWHSGVGTVRMDSHQYVWATDIFEYQNNSPLYGFGGWWDIDPSYTGLSLVGLPSPTDTVFNPQGNHYDAFDGWWFVLTTTPINYVQLFNDDGGVSYSFSKTYWADPPETQNPIPEPSPVILLAVGLMAFGVYRKKSASQFV